MPAIIRSRHNEIIKTAVRLSGSPGYRRERGLYLIEGARLCADAAGSGVRIRALFYTERAAEKYAGYLESVKRVAGESYIIGPQAEQALAQTKSPQGIFCVCLLPDRSEQLPSLRDGGSFLALEDLQDPSNLGTVLRTAEALGADGVILGGNGCDPYSPKALRASMGAVFRLPIFTAADFAEAVVKMNREGFRTVAAVPDGKAVPVTKIDWTSPCMLVVGNEGNGLSAEARAACSERATIPMRGRAESLNASAAAAILLWEMMRGEGGGA